MAENESGNELMKLFIELGESYRYIVSMVMLYALTKKASEDIADEVLDRLLRYIAEENEKIERLANTAVANYELRCEI